MYKQYYLPLLPFNVLSLLLSVCGVWYLFKYNTKSHFKYLLLTQVGNILTQIITISLSVIFSSNPDFDYYGVRNDNVLNLLMTFLARLNVLFIVLTSTRVLSTFKVLTETITPRTITLLTRSFTTTFCVVNLPIWALIILNWSQTPSPTKLIQMISNSSFSLWLLVAIIYEDLQALYLARLIYLYNPSNYKPQVKKTYTLVSYFSLLACLIDWVGLGLYISFMFNEEGLQLVNQVIVSLPGIHGVILGFVLGRLKRLVFMGTSSNDTSVGSTEIFGKSSARSARSSVPEEIKSLPRRWIDFWNDDTPSAVKSIVQI